MPVCRGFFLLLPLLFFLLMKSVSKKDLALVAFLLCNKHCICCGRFREVGEKGQASKRSWATSDRFIFDAWTSRMFRDDKSVLKKQRLAVRQSWVKCHCHTSKGAVGQSQENTSSYSNARSEQSTKRSLVPTTWNKGFISSPTFHHTTC